MTEILQFSESVSILRYYKKFLFSFNEVFTGLPLLLPSESPLFLLASHADDQNQKNVLVSVHHGFTITSVLLSAPLLNQANSLLAFLVAEAV